MDNLFLFNPQEREYKTPFGAVRCGEKIRISSKMCRTWVCDAELLVFSEKTGEDKCMPMVWDRKEKDMDVYVCELSADDTAGVFWYCFKVHTLDGNVVFCGKNGMVNELQSVQRYQLTVCSKNYVTPSWFSEGVTYHVFVDRFFRDSGSEKLSDDDFFYVHSDSSEAPFFKPNEKGEVENRDIYGGNIKGITEKLSYLETLGVKTIYLSPVFEAWSNHKYNTADYKKIDSHFGTEEDLSSLCKEAKKCGMRVILDGVFSHTGSDSIYFNREGRYDNDGAFGNPDSKYREWFDFWENGKYSSWWGIDTLPQVNELASSYQDYIINDDDSVIAHWMRAGVSGWRLDVADELPDEFIGNLKTRALQENSEALVIGEVWEDASTKKAYGVNKTYFTDGVLDGVMNYPLKNAILSFLRREISAKHICDDLNSLVENYPDVSQRCLMNIIGTHDTVRVLNELSVGNLSGLSKEERAERELSEPEMKIGKTKLRQAAVMQYMFPGSPCIYYGDEIGMQGFEDPFNRRYFTWGNVDSELLEFYRKLGKIKADFKSLQNGEFTADFFGDDVLVLKRACDTNGSVISLVNRGEKTKLFKIPENFKIVLESGRCICKNGIFRLPESSCCIIANAGDIC